MQPFEDLKAKCTWCGEEMEKEVFEEEGIIKAKLSCKENPECELSQVIVWIDHPEDSSDRRN